MIEIDYTMPDGTPGNFKSESMVAVLAKIDEIQFVLVGAKINKVTRDGVPVTMPGVR